MITLEKVKLYLGITNTDKDTEIELYIPIVQGKIESLCNITLGEDEEEGETPLPLHLAPTVSKLVAWEYKRQNQRIDDGGVVSSKSLGSLSVSYKDIDLDRSTQWPTAMVGELRRDLRVPRVFR